ncbi:glycosyltransferase 87 family protein [Actinomadura sp. 3N407]|uniref:glycosyltransferase 87 family protein n=1 Tax=Actinomadura sp. 3N407 TaxID=3457423 RepID=UPI003FCD09CB
MFVILLLPGYPTDPVTGDTGLYREWAGQIVTGHFPVADERWQYPPLAALMIVPPHLPGTVYGLWFMLAALLLDLLVLRLLLRVPRQAMGAWCWIAGLFLLGPVCYFRLDLLVTAIAVCALLVMARSRAFGALVAVGMLIKAWPAVLLLSLPRNRACVRAVTAFVLTAAGVVGLVSLFLDDPWAFVGGQGGRGIEIEAVAAVPFHVAKLFGWTGSIEYRYGSWELLGPGIEVAGRLSMGLTLAGLALVGGIAWRRRPDTWDPAFGAEVALTATLIVMITSRVLSPQYMIWVIGVAAVCLSHQGARRGPVALLILVAAGVTHLEFPVAWYAVRDGDPFATGIVAARNLLLLAAAAIMVRRLWAGRRIGDEDEEVRPGQG